MEERNVQLVTFSDILAGDKKAGFSVLPAIKRQFGIADHQSSLVLDSKASDQIAITAQGASLVIVGHTDASAQGIGPYRKATKFVDALNKKVPVEDRKKIQHIYLIACEAGFLGNERATLAQQIADLLATHHYGGDAGLQVHAITNTNLGADPNPTGMRVEVTTEGRLSAFTVDSKDEKLLRISRESRDAKTKTEIGKLKTGSKCIVRNAPLKETLDSVEHTFVPVSQMLRYLEKRQIEKDDLIAKIKEIAEKIKGSAWFKLLRPKEKGVGKFAKKLGVRTLEERTTKFDANMAELIENIQNAKGKPLVPVIEKIRFYNQKKSEMDRAGSSLFRLLRFTAEFLLNGEKQPITKVEEPRRSSEPTSEEDSDSRRSRESSTDASEMAPLLSESSEAPQSEPKTIEGYINQAIEMLKEIKFDGEKRKNKFIDGLCTLRDKLCDEVNKTDPAENTTIKQNNFVIAKKTLAMATTIQTSPYSRQRKAAVNDWEKQTMPLASGWGVGKIILTVALYALGLVGGVICTIYFARTNAQSRINQSAKSGIAAIPDKAESEPTSGSEKSF